MNGSPNLSALHAFARDQIDASRHPDAHHSFTLSKCSECGLVPFELTIEHHTGSRHGDFKGVITGRCVQCGKHTRILSFTGKHRKPQREETPACRCGNKTFFVAEVERIERDEGLPGFFDQGVVAGQCSRCGHNQVMVHTD